LITPLKAGPLKIPSNVIQGEMLLKNGSHGGSPFDDNFHFFSMIGGINQLKPFALASKEEVLEIEPMIAGITPWLPVKSLKIEETWDDSHSLQVGEPFSRGFKITAEGIKSTHLPSLNDLQKGDEFFKIYADKPVLGDEGKGGNLISYRQEQYTLIPQQPGTFTLPEILITWWDVIKKEKVISRIPSRVVKVIPSQYKSSPEISEKGVNDGVVIETKRDFFLYMILGGVIVLLIGAIIWGVMLQNKIKGLRDGSKPKPPSPPVHCSLKENSPKKNKNERLKDLNPT
jgi:hypothetical protein